MSLSLQKPKPFSLFVNMPPFSAHSSPTATPVSGASSLTATPVPITTDGAAINECNPVHFLQKRVLFVSAIQLYRSYAKIPSFILENALFAFGIKRCWILPETPAQNSEAKTTYIYHFVSNWSSEFIQIIKRKDEKGHILWIEPCDDNNSEQYWSKISDQLCQIVDLSVSEMTTKSPEIADELSENNGVQSRPSLVNIFHAREPPKTKHLSISEQILSPITSSEFTFTNYTDDEGMNTDSDFDQEEEDEKVSGFEDKSRPSLRDLFDEEKKKSYYLPLKLDRNWWLNSYVADADDSIFNFQVKVQDIMRQIECVETVNDLQFGALKELFYQSNPTLIPMEYFDVRMYFEAHMEDKNKNKYSALLDYCDTNHLYAYKKYKSGDKDINYDSDKQSTDLMQTRSLTCDASIISVESNSLLPFRGKIGFDSSHEVQLFDSSTTATKCSVSTKDVDEIKLVSDEELNHLEYYLSNTIVSCSRSSERSADYLHLKQQKQQKQQKRKKRKVKTRNNKNEWNYEPPSNSQFRAKGNILITKQMTNEIVPQKIAEDIVNLWQYIDKSSVLSKDLTLIINKIQIMYFDFHSAETHEKLYCVCDENVEKQTNHKWRMRNKLYTASELALNKLSCAASIRESVSWKKELQKEDAIRDFILNKRKMHAIIEKTKWNKVVTQTKHHSKKRMTLSVTCEEFVKHLENYRNESNDDEIALVPIIMFKHNTYRMEFVWILTIEQNIDIGIAIIYHEEQQLIEICGIHLDKTYIANQCELIGAAAVGHHKLNQYRQYLARFKSTITNLHIGNPDDLLNRIKDLQKRNVDLKKDKQKLQKQVADLHDLRKKENEKLRHLKEKYDKLMANLNGYH